jgi:hypothetical protein
MPKDLKLAQEFFESIGFTVVHMVQDNFYLLVPIDPSEGGIYGTPCLSPRAIQAIEDKLSKGIPLSN